MALSPPIGAIGTRVTTLKQHRPKMASSKSNMMAAMLSVARGDSVNSRRSRFADQPDDEPKKAPPGVSSVSRPATTTTGRQVTAKPASPPPVSAPEALPPAPPQPQIKKRTLPAGWVNFQDLKKQASGPSSKSSSSKAPPIPVLKRSTGKPKAPAKPPPKKVPLIALPYEVLLSILHYLPAHHILRVRRLCKTVRDVADDPGLWHSISFSGIHTWIPGQKPTFHVKTASGRPPKATTIPVISDLALRSLATRIANRARADNVDGFQSVRLSEFGNYSADTRYAGTRVELIPETMSAVIGLHAASIRSLEITRISCFGQRHWELISRAPLTNLESLSIVVQESSLDSISGICALVNRTTRLHRLELVVDFTSIPPIDPSVLQHLEALHTNSPWIAKRIGHGIWTLPNLQELKLTNCEMMDDIPKIRFPPKLRQITLKQHSLTGPSLLTIFAPMKKLAVLDISGARFGRFVGGGIEVQDARQLWEQRRALVEDAARKEGEESEWVMFEKIVVEGRVYSGQ